MLRPHETYVWVVIYVLGVVTTFRINYRITTPLLAPGECRESDCDLAAAWPFWAFVAICLSPIIVLYYVCNLGLSRKEHDD